MLETDKLLFEQTKKELKEIGKLWESAPLGSSDWGESQILYSIKIEQVLNAEISKNISFSAQSNEYIDKLADKEAELDDPEQFIELCERNLAKIKEIKKHLNQRYMELLSAPWKDADFEKNWNVYRIYLIQRREVNEKERILIECKESAERDLAEANYNYLQQPDVKKALGDYARTGNLSYIKSLVSPLKSEMFSAEKLEDYFMPYLISAHMTMSDPWQRIALGLCYINEDNNLPLKKSTPALGSYYINDAWSQNTECINSVYSGGRAAWYKRKDPVLAAQMWEGYMDYCEKRYLSTTQLSPQYMEELKVSAEHFISVGMILGDLYRGIQKGLQIDLKKAAKYYQCAVEVWLKFPKAYNLSLDTIYQLGLLYYNNKVDDIAYIYQNKYLTIAADKGHTGAGAIVASGIIRQAGWIQGRPYDEATVMRYLEPAYKEGQIYAIHYMGAMYCIWGKWTEAISCYEKTKEQYPASWANLGVIYYKQKDYIKAAACLKQACLVHKTEWAIGSYINRHMSNTAYHLPDLWDCFAQCCHYGYGDCKELQETAVYYLEKASGRANCSGLTYYLLANEYSQRFKYSYVLKALENWHKAMERKCYTVPVGISEALFICGCQINLLFPNNIGLDDYRQSVFAKQNRSWCLRMLKTLADKGNQIAKFEYGNYLLRLKTTNNMSSLSRDGVSEITISNYYEEIEKYFEDSYNSPNGDDTCAEMAALARGLLALHRGYDIKAYSWLKKAAEKGNNRAQLLLNQFGVGLGIVFGAAYKGKKSNPEFYRCYRYID